MAQLHGINVLFQGPAQHRLASRVPPCYLPRVSFAQANSAAVGIARVTLHRFADGGFIPKFIPSHSSCHGCLTA